MSLYNFFREANYTIIFLMHKTLLTGLTKKFLNKKPTCKILSKEVLSNKLNSLWEKIS